MRQARDSYYQSQRQAHANGGTAEQYAGMPQWARNFFASRPELTPVEKLRKCAKERYSSGVALLAVASSLRCFRLAQWAASSAGHYFAGCFGRRCGVGY